MKIILAVIRDTDSANVLNQLVNGGHRVTRLASSGGFLRRGSTTLLIGLEENQVPEVIDLIKDSCGPPEAEQHRVTLFVIDAKHFEQI